MHDRDELQQSFDPRTWMQESAGGEISSSPARNAQRGVAAPRPPFFLATAAAVGIFSIGATGAFLTRADAPAATQVAAAMEQSADAANGPAAGASVAGDQP